MEYRDNYIYWILDFDIPFTNNLSESNLRGIKSKMKVSGQFQNINQAKEYANIRSYIETCSLYDKMNLSEILRQLKYKAIWNNKRLYQINTYYPSSQVCSNFKTKNTKLKDLSIRKLGCSNCHMMHDKI